MKIEDSVMSNEPLIIGSGLAGLLAALELTQLGCNCTLITKAPLPVSNTAFAQGGIAAVIPHNASDSVKRHIANTLAAGAGLSDPQAAQLIVSHGYELIQRLLKLGVSFDMLPSNLLAVAAEGGHDCPRIVHHQDTTGSAITSALINKIRNTAGITIMENTPVVELTIDSNGFCRGAVALVNGRPVQIWASSVLLATGGLGRLYSRTTNPAVATGDGIALAYRAGARVVDMEFVQFHPTALMIEGAPAFLISEAVRGEGAVLLDDSGRRFMQRFHASAELATRDVVARAIYTVMKEQNSSCVWLDMQAIKDVAADKFPNIIKTCRQYGIDPLTQLVPVAPAAHYSMGGVQTDYSGLTNIAGLYAAGECACIGLHGANRLASNSLLEAGVMAIAAAQSIASSKYPTHYPKRAAGNVLAMPNIFADADRLPALMYEKVGLERNEQGLTEFIYKAAGQHKQAAEISPASAEQANMLVVGKLIAESALARQESRGSHWRSDYPERDDNNYLRHYYQSTSGNGWVEVVAAVESLVYRAGASGAAAKPVGRLTLL